MTSRSGNGPIPDIFVIAAGTMRSACSGAKARPHGHAKRAMSAWAAARRIAALVLLLAGQAAHAGEDIVAVLARSQTMRLERMSVVDAASPRARTVRASFENLVQGLGMTPPPALRVIQGETVAETLQGRIVVANAALADLTEGERSFILAHELAHVALGHWAQTERLYQRWVPGEVTPAQTDPVADLLARDASALAYRQEFDADACALRALHLLGLPPHDAVSAFMRTGLTQDTATHPGTRKRLASLRAAEALWSEVDQPMTSNQPVAWVNPKESAVSGALALHQAQRGR